MSSETGGRRRRRRSSSGKTRIEAGGYPGGLGVLITTALLSVILVTGPILLGSARLWVDLPILDLVALLLLVQGLRLALNKPAGPRALDAIDLSALLFAGYAVVRWLTSPTEYFSRVEALDVVGYAGIFLTCRHGLANRSFALFLVYLLVALGLGEAIFGYYLSHHLDWFPFGDDERLQLHYAPRWLGTYGCPNHYGALLVMAVAAALAVGSFSKLQWPVRIVFIYLALVLMIGVIYSASRGSYLGLMAALVALVTLGIRNGTLRWWVPVGGALMLLVVTIFLFSLSPIARERTWEFYHMASAGNFNAEGRVQLARDALHIAHDHPIFGTGPGTFVFVHPRYQDSTFAYKAVLTHDDYLNCLDDYGLVGFALAIFFVAAVTLKFFRPLEIDSRWQDRVIVVTAFAAWCALLVHSLVDFNLHIPANARMLFALTGLGLSRIKPEPHWSAFSLTPLGKWVGGTVIGFTLVYAAIVTRTAVGDIIYENAFKYVDEVPNSESITAVQDSLFYDAGNARALAFLGDLHRVKASRQEQMDGREEEGRKALEAYTAARRANLLDDTIGARMGLTFDVMRRYPEAFFCYQEAVTNQPYDGQFWYRLGNHFQARGMMAKAEEAYLLSMSCPHGGEGSAEAEAQLRALPEMENVPKPAAGANPLVETNEVREVTP